MKKLKMFLVVAVMFLLVIPVVSHAETGQKCASVGAMTTQQALQMPLRQHLLTLQRPKSDLNGSLPSAEAGIVLASSRDDLDRPCYVGGKYAGNCSLNKPYYNVFSGECYATLPDCKEADGDLKNVPGSGGCVRCGKME